MAKTSVASLGFSLPMPGVEDVGWDSNRSLLEFDIIVVEPSLHSQYASDNYNGVPCFSETSSSSVITIVNNWKLQLTTAFEAGKTIIVSLTSPESYYYHTGKTDWSGTGKNARKTNIVSPLSNYDMIPMSIASQQEAVGHKMNCVSDSSEIRSLWSSVASLFQYQFYFLADNTEKILIVSGSDKIVGAVAKGKGTMFLMPPPFIHFDDWQDEEGEWNSAGVAAGRRALEFFLQMADAVRSDSSAGEVPPEWVVTDRYRFPQEAQFEMDTVSLAAQIERLVGERQQKERLFQEYISPKVLLYGKGAALEAAVRDCLTELGVNASNFSEGDLEFDVVFSIDDKRCLGEVEGKDNKPIDVAKISQLSRCLTEDFARDDVEEFAKGILFGNPFRKTEPSDRPALFTDKVITASVRAGISLVSTHLLYDLLMEYRRSGSRADGLEVLRKLHQHEGGIFLV